MAKFGSKRSRAEMKPYVICHMNTSVDGRILGSRWRPAENRMAGLFESLHDRLGGGSWLIGRVTGSEYAKAKTYPGRTGQTYPREAWFARREEKRVGAHGREHVGEDLAVDGNQPVVGREGTRFIARGS